jgi:hypothetical protein
VADGDGAAEFDDGEGGDGDDGEVVGQAEVVVEEAGDGLADLLAGALVGDFDGVVGAGAFETTGSRFNGSRFTVAGTAKPKRGGRGRGGGIAKRDFIGRGIPF